MNKRTHENAIMENAPTKKMSLGAKKCIFQLTFHQPAVLIAQVDIAGSVLKEIEFQVCDSNEFRGLSIRSMDAKQVCLVVSRLECDDVVTNKDGATIPPFRVRTVTLKTCLQAISSTDTLRLSQFEGESEPRLHLVSWDPASPAECSRFKISTVVPSDEPTPPFNQMTYDFSVNMDLNMLRGLVKMYKDLKAEDVSISIYSLIEESVGAPSKFFLIGAEADDADVSKRLFSVESHTAGEADYTTEGIDINEDDYKECCAEQFSTEYLGLFLKHMDKPSVNVRLSRGMPILITCALGTGSSSLVCFVLAPRQK